MTTGQSQELKYTAWSKVEREHLSALIDREMIVGDKIMLARVYIQKDGHVPLHHHHNEQVTYILEGALKFAIDGKKSSSAPAKFSASLPTCPTKPGPSKTPSTSTSSTLRAKTG